MTDNETKDLLKRIAVAVEMIAGMRLADAGGEVAVDTADLDSKYGDPLVRAKDPRDWTGEPMKGRNFSQCPPEYLDMLAARFDFFASRESDPKKAKYNRLDASRARGWAARKRGGWQSPQVVDASPFETFETSGFVGVVHDDIDAEIPF